MNDIEKGFLTTGGLAKGICRPATVRRYEELELLRPVARDNAGRRLYSPEQRPVLQQIMADRIANRGFGRGRSAA